MQTWLPGPTLSPLGSVNLDSFPKQPKPNSVLQQREVLIHDVLTTVL